MDNKRFGEFIAGLRKEKGYTQSQLAEILCVTDKAVSKCASDIIGLNRAT